ncbi:TPA: hypothetical protein ACJGLM_003815, partial [Salmonella enterica subsp. enterica serovar Weltevreden]
HNFKIKSGEEIILRAFRIMCHVKNATAASHSSVVLQHKWLTATMSNSDLPAEETGGRSESG